MPKPPSAYEKELEPEMTTTSVLQEVDVQKASGVCHFCGAGIEQTFVDLGMSPLCESYLSSADLNRGETSYPLHVYAVSYTHLLRKKGKLRLVALSPNMKLP